MASGFSLVTFECALADEAEPHEICVVGDHPALGCWDVSQGGVPLCGAAKDARSPRGLHRNRRDRL